MYLARLLSFLVGFLSLSQEILWIRLFGFTNFSLPQAFAFVLTLFLIGIAVGALIGKRFCSASHQDLWVISGKVLILASIFDLLSPWIYADFSQTGAQIYLGGFLIFLTACLKAIIFPIAHHLGSPASGSKVGRTVSRVYVANIVGSTLGPIVTGMILLRFLTTQQCFALIAAVVFMVGIVCLKPRLHVVKLFLASFVALFFVVIALNQPSHLLIESVAVQAGEVKRVVENPQGILVIYNGGNKGDIIYGANVYDGRTNLDPVLNSNGINRLLVLASLQDKPERVLMIGLSIGSWLKLVTSFPDVKHIDVVEINPGYLKAMQDYPQIRTVLTDPRVHIHVDDARRWLRIHPDNRYDLVVMNTTFHWRSYSANLLSQEFLTLVKNHMAPRAVFAYNATGSIHALKTATTVFPYAYLYENFVISSDFDWRYTMRDPKSIQKLATLKLDGKLLFPNGSEKRIRGFLKEPIFSIKFLDAAYGSIYRIFAPELETITDRNLITEYKYGRTLV